MESIPKTDPLVEEEMRSGHVHPVNDLVLADAEASLERDAAKPRRSLYELLSEPPFANSELDLERKKDYPRPIDL